MYTLQKSADFTDIYIYILSLVEPKKKEELFSNLHSASLAVLQCD